jgi:cytochrome P450
MRLPFQVPEFIPTPANRRLRRARRTFERILRAAIDRARKDPTSRTLTAMLVNAVDEETNDTLDEKQVLDELVGFVLAGHETTANALSWTLFYLAQHPATEERLLGEYKAILGDRPAGAGDLQHLIETKKVLNESMRLMPSAWLIPRTAVGDDQIGGFPIHRGQIVWLITWLLHRHPSSWERPEEFNPDRFDPEPTKSRHRFAYLPFGVGQKMCIGAGFAMLEMQLALPSLLRHFRFHLPKGVQIEPECFVTLRPRGGMPMIVTRRESA